MKKLQILIIGVMFLLNASAARAFQTAENRFEILAPSDTTQNITQTGNYRVTVRGADGGNDTSGNLRGGSGATISATFSLQAGDTLRLVTGIAGGNAGISNFGNSTGGGGGGSAVILTRGGTQTILIVAGAGAGAAGIAGGGGGNSGQGTAGGGAGSIGGGGGGFSANGGNGQFGAGGGGAGTLSSGGAGGAGTEAAGSGGYGFGGGGGGNYGGGGGGGGYGGGYGGNSGSGSGGSSYVDAIGTNVTRTDGATGGGTNQNGSVNVAIILDTTQQITQTGNYRVTVRGADGGTSSNFTTKGGSGATVAATFSLQAGDVLTLVTGIAGQSNGGPAGGGGGSAVILTRNGTQTLLIVAGAGGGMGPSNSGGGGISAQGMAGGGARVFAAGGGGFNADGANYGSQGGGKAGTLAGGGAGGTGGASDGGYGFGGGGAASNPSDFSGGGGGGYGGGNGGTLGDGGGGRGGSGGSSYVDASGTNVTRTDGVTGGGTSQNGSISINFLPPTAASVSISGRVLTDANRGLINALVYLTDLEGNTRVTRTSTFGYYRFADIATGQTVIMTVVSKRYQFASQVISVNEGINELNFFSQSQRQIY